MTILFFLLAITSNQEGCNYDALALLTHGTIWDGQQFVAIRDNTITTSRDGIFYETLGTAPQAHLERIFSNGASYLVVGYDHYYVSEDLRHWRSAPRASYDSVLEVLWAKDRWVIVSDNYSATSPDGLTWETSAVSVGSFHNIVLFNDQFIASGNPIKSSSNGKDWIIPEQPQQASRAFLLNGRLFAINGQDILQSEDGIQWQATSLGDSALRLNSMVYNGSLYLALADRGRLFTSTDGQSWVEQNALAGANRLYGYGTEVITTGANWYSSEGTQWLQLGNFAQSFLLTPSRAYYRGGFVEQGQQFLTDYRSTNFENVNGRYFTRTEYDLLVSLDGYVWRRSAPGPVGRVTYDQGRWVFFSGGMRYTSHDGFSWDAQAAPGLDYDVIQLNGRFFRSNRMSEDGQIWHRITLDTTFNLIWTGQVYISPDSGFVYRSTDGRNWQRSYIGHGHTRVVQLGDTLSLGNEDGLFLSYDMGANWVRAFAAVDRVYDLATWNERVYAIDGDGHIWSSSDGLYWQKANTPSLRHFYSFLNSTSQGLMISNHQSSHRLPCAPELITPLILPKVVIPWVTANSTWQSRIRLTSQDDFDAILVLEAEDRTGNRAQKRLILGAGEALDVFAQDLFPGMTGYNIQFFSPSPNVGAQLMLYRTDNATGELAASVLPASQLGELSEKLLFPFVPGGEVPVVALTNLQSEQADTHVLFELFDQDGMFLAQAERTLIGARPFAATIAGLFEGIELPAQGSVRATADDGSWLAGAGFVFNQAGQPSIARAQSLHPD